MKKITPLILVVFLLSANIVNAASLYIDPSGASFSKDDTFTAKIRLNTDSEECINAAEIRIDYPENLINVIDVSDGESIFTLWVEEPKINKDEGFVSFAGGIPGGYCGRIPGDPGLTNVIATLILQPNINADEPVNIPISFTENGNTVLLNDGRGTEASLELYGAEFSIQGTLVEGRGEWFDLLDEDNTAPESFTIELTKNNQVFDGKYYIAFSTTDKGSGIDHYEVLEKQIDDDFLARLFWFTRDDQEWRPAESPYVLRDQDLNSVISVKAVDNAGNERIATLIPPEALRKDNIVEDLVPLLIIGSILGGLVLFVKKKKQSINNES
ncbi:MAG: hypothetical protein R3346_01640 [Candidatus Spechtbacterales bacterium]|nr:hypothetical protein [Candidatus Spechtbacterales bacterium]